MRIISGTTLALLLLILSSSIIREAQPRGFAEAELQDDIVFVKTLSILYGQHIAGHADMIYSRSYGGEHLRRRINDTAYENVYLFPDGIMSLHVTANNSIVVFTDPDFTNQSALCRIWISHDDGATFANIKNLTTPTVSGFGIDSSPDSSRIFFTEYGIKTASNDRPIHVWEYNASGWTVIHTFENATGVHGHVAAYDPHTDWIWLSHGDEKKGIFYSDDGGSTFHEFMKFRKSGDANGQPCDIEFTEAHVIFADEWNSQILVWNKTSDVIECSLQPNTCGAYSGPCYSLMIGNHGVIYAIMQGYQANTNSTLWASPDGKAWLLLASKPELQLQYMSEPDLNGYFYTGGQIASMKVKDLTKEELYVLIYKRDNNKEWTIYREETTKVALCNTLLSGVNLTVEALDSSNIFGREHASLEIDSDFDGQADGWSDFGACAHVAKSVDTTTYYEGNASQYLVVNVTGASNGGIVTSPAQTVSPSTDYMITFYIRCNWTVDVWLVSTADATFLSARYPAETGNRWLRYQNRFTTPSTTNDLKVYVICLHSDVDSLTYGRYWLDGLMVEELVPDSPQGFGYTEGSGELKGATLKVNGETFSIGDLPAGQTITKALSDTSVQQLLELKLTASGSGKASITIAGTVEATMTDCAITNKLSSSLFQGKHFCLPSISTTNDYLIVLADRPSTVSSVSYASARLQFTVTAETAATSSTKVYCGKQGEPQAIYTTMGTLTWSYDPPTEMLTLKVTHESPTRIVIYWKFPGDIDDDGDVGCYDLFILARAYGTSLGEPKYHTRADLDNNGDVNLDDLSILEGNYGRAE